MKSLFKLSWLLIAVVMLTFVSCNNDDEDVVIAEVEQLGEVSFDVENFIQNLTAKPGDYGNKEDIICNDGLEADYVYVKLNGVEYNINLVTLTSPDGEMQSEVIKLAPGTYTIEDFAVFNNGVLPNDESDDVVLFASPDAASSYVNDWGMIGVGGTFTIEAFKKAPVKIDVLCYVPSSYEDFGFTWFQFKKFKAKKIYFFGDVCTKFWKDWKDEPNSPYADIINGFDFPANFSVDLYVGTDTSGTPNVSGIYDAGAFIGIDAEPLCIEYVDNLNSIDETYTFVINLQLPDGTFIEIHSGTFTDANWSMENPTGTEDNTLNFGGLDGVYDFVVGNCSYDGNDANAELPAWLPVPTSGTVSLSNYGNGGSDGYLTATFTNLVGDQHPDVLQDGMVLPMWCVDKAHTINANGTYQGTFYSSIGDLTGLNTNFNTANVGALNWLINNKDGHDDSVVQSAIWKITDNSGSGNTLSTNALSHNDFIPSVGDWAIIFCDFGTSTQLMIVRVDP